MSPSASLLWRLEALERRAAGLVNDQAEAVDVAELARSLQEAIAEADAATVETYQVRALRCLGRVFEALEAGAGVYDGTRGSGQAAGSGRVEG